MADSTRSARSPLRGKLHGITWAPGNTFAVEVTYTEDGPEGPAEHEVRHWVVAFTPDGAPVVSSGNRLVTGDELADEYRGDDVLGVSWSMTHVASPYGG